MSQSNFSQRKQDVLSKLDKSSKGHWDGKISELCEKINSSENYYTTSSCSGRVVLMLDKERKEKGLYFKIYHDLISFEELKKDLDEILHSQARDMSKELLKENSGINSISEKNLAKPVLRNQSRAKRASLIKFKQEPPILHIACKTLKDAESFLSKARKSGWKRSGIISIKTKYMLELISTEKLEFPIINMGKILVDNDFLELIVQKCNENLKKGWKKIDALKDNI